MTEGRTIPERPLATLAGAAVVSLILYLGAGDAISATFRSYGSETEKFTFELPPDELVLEKDGEVNVSIQSGQGYVFGLLGEPGKVPLETRDLVGKAEEFVLGEGRFWEKKLQTQIVMVGGLPAYDGTYEGPDTRGRLVIARGEEIDLVFFFRTWRDRYASLVPVFDSILTSFQWKSGLPAQEAAPEKPTDAIPEVPPETPEEETTSEPGTEAEPSAAEESPQLAEQPPATAEEAKAVDEILAYFETIIFGAEYDKSLATNVVARWEGPVRIALQGKPTDQHRDYIRRHIEQIARVTGLTFEWSNNGQGPAANMTIVFVPRRQMAQVKIPKVDQALQSNLAAQGGCYFISYREPESRIVASVVVVNNEREEYAINHCLLEEITQSLGLPNDSDALRPSLFSDRDQLLAYSRHDEILIRTLYDPRLKPGLPKAQALPVAREIILELHRKLPRDGGAARNAARTSP